MKMPLLYMSKLARNSSSDKFNNRVWKLLLGDAGYGEYVGCVRNYVVGIGGAQL